MTTDLTIEQAVELLKSINQKFKFNVCIENNRICMDLYNIKSVECCADSIDLYINQEGKQTGKQTNNQTNNQTGKQVDKQKVYFRRISDREERLSYLKYCVKRLKKHKLTELQPFIYAYEADAEYFIYNFDKYLDDKTKKQLTIPTKTRNTFNAKMCFDYMMQNHSNALDSVLKKWYISKYKKLQEKVYKTFQRINEVECYDYSDDDEEICEEEYDSD